MSNPMLMLCQVLSILVTVCGLALAFWHIWVLARKLRRHRRDAFVIEPTEVRADVIDRRILLQAPSDRAAHATAPRRVPRGHRSAGDPSNGT